MIRAKSTAQNATNLSGIIKWGSASVLYRLKSPVLQFLKRYPSISVFLFAADGHFINYRSLDFRLLDCLIRCRSTIDFKLGRRYSSYLPLLPAHIRQNWLGPTCCCATRHSRSPMKAGALLVPYNLVQSLVVSPMCVSLLFQLFEHFWGRKRNQKCELDSLDVCAQPWMKLVEKSH